MHDKELRKKLFLKKRKKKVQNLGSLIAKKN